MPKLPHKHGFIGTTSAKFACSGAMLQRTLVVAPTYKIPRFEPARPSRWLAALALATLKQDAT
eukprot:NODE_23960_length_644_cov_4.110251.p6 GENE.NODE_23960_length_644_cov_4.110251~~NODE_23960_length_644_cov_4.110251.p6  ORF type:complete len:63 (+),score=3.58 NODE_23960_length_644_cov_4.110251:380-568(+)